jgi:hypothetical protein
MIADQNGPGDLIDFIKQKLSSRPEGFLKDQTLLGSWVECYLRGSFALMNRPWVPFITTRFRDNIDGKEIDLVNICPKILLEITVQHEDKKDKDVHFHLLRGGSERCILTTSKTIDLVEMNGVPVMKLPYYMVAAFIDRGDLPEYEHLSII